MASTTLTQPTQAPRGRRRPLAVAASASASAAALALAGVLAPTGASGATATPQPPPARPAPLANYVTNGTVNALARDGATLFLGGAFSRIGPRTGGGVVLDPGSGLRATQFPDVLGTGFAIVPDMAGGYYLGGRFTAVGGVPRKNLAHILADGTVDPAFTQTTDGDVLTLALDSGRPGVHYRIRVSTSAKRGPRGGVRTLRAVARGARRLPQEGCI